MGLILKEELKKSKSQKEFASLLTYRSFFNEKTVYMKDGGFQAHFVYTAQDMDSSTGEMLDAASYSVLQALNLLEDGWMIETNTLSRPIKQKPSQNHFQSVVPALIDDSRRHYFSQENGFFESLNYLSITYVPTGQAGKKALSFLVEGQEKKDEVQKEYEHFESITESFLSLFEQITANPSGGNGIDELSISNTNLRRLEKGELVNYLMSCIYGLECHYKLPKTPLFLDSFISNADFIPGIVPSMGNKKIKVLTIDEIPEYTTPGILDILNYLGFSYRWSTRFIALSKDTAAFYLKKQKASWYNKAIGIMGLFRAAQGGAVKMGEASSEQYSQVVDAVKENELGAMRYGFMSMNIVLMEEDEDRLAEAVYQIKKAIEDKYFKVREETINTCSAYLGSIPGHGCYNVRKPLTDSLYVSQVLPISSVWGGEATCPCDKYPENSPALMQVRTNGSRVHNFNMHVGDVGHMTVYGPTGGGKSTLLQAIMAAHCRYDKSRVLVLDKNHSHREFILSIGGKCLDVLGGVSFSPLKILASLEEGSAEFNQELSFIVSWVEDICMMQSVEITPERSSLIKDAIETLYYSKGSLDLDLLSFQEESLRQAFRNFLQSAAGNILIGDNDPFDDFDVLSIDMTNLLELPAKIFMPVVKILLHRIEIAFLDKRPTLFLIEELKTYLKYEIFNKMVETYLLTLRKQNVAVVMIIQQIEHVLESSVGSTIISQCFSNIFLPNPELRTNKNQAKAYKGIGLNEQQISIIANAIPKRDYYLSSYQGNRLFSLDLDPLSLAFMGISKQTDIESFRSIYKANDPRWVLDWLEYKGLHDWKEYTQETYFGRDKNVI